MLFVEKEGLEGVKYNIDFGVRGESTLGEGTVNVISTMQKGAFL